MPYYCITMTSMICKYKCSLNTWRHFIAYCVFKAVEIKRKHLDPYNMVSDYGSLKPSKIINQILYTLKLRQTLHYHSNQMLYTFKLVTQHIILLIHMIYYFLYSTRRTLTFKTQPKYKSNINQLQSNFVRNTAHLVISIRL